MMLSEEDMEEVLLLMVVVVEIRTTRPEVEEPTVVIQPIGLEVPA
jgi:hypothetical protein